MILVLIIAANTTRCFEGDIETFTLNTCYCKCASGLYYCDKYNSRPYLACPYPVRTMSDIPVKTPTQSPVNTPKQSPVKTPARTPAKTPVKTPNQSPDNTLNETISASTFLPTGTRPYYCFVTCKQQILPKTWFLLILGLI
jgi:hypothetical protein